MAHTPLHPDSPRGTLAHTPPTAHPNTRATDPTPMPQRTQTLSILGYEFTAPLPYAAGHALNEDEATALNGLLAENLRNNFSRRVKDALKPGGENAQLDVNQLTDLRNEFAEYAGQYRLGAATRAVRDPIAREAHKIATALVREDLNAKGVDRASLAEGEFNAKVDKVAAHTAVMAEARRRVETSKRALAGALSVLDE